MGLNKPLFPLLEKIFGRSGISEQTAPSNLEQWQEFLNRVNNSLHDFEQERYLLERSMVISSREMVELNERFESAQNVAHIGYWYYNRSADQILWSKETYRLFGFDPSFPVPSFETLMKMIYEEDRPSLLQLIERALAEGKDYEKEFRINNALDKKTYWVYVKGHPYKKKEETASVTKSEYLLSGVIMDITERKIAEEEVKKLNQKMISLSRQAGMSEVATSVLHNIGNLLNSVNVSIALINETIINSDIKNLVKVSQMINDNLPTKPDYLASDPKGKLIPKYLSDLSKNVITEQEDIKKEIFNLTRNVDHIKDIVAMQKDISGIAGVKEKIYLPEVCDLAIQMGCATPEKYGITVIKKYEFNDFIVIDRARLLQILVNLISNAKDALMTSHLNTQNILTVSIKKTDKSFIEIIVQDNGIGISKTDLTKIFSMGFSTKLSGHGFGLHSSAIAANELGGNIVVDSEGKGKGANFTLKVPNEQRGVLAGMNNQKGDNNGKSK